MSSALRQRAVCAARQARPTGVRNTRGYASGGHDHHHAPPQVEEKLGAYTYFAFGVVPASIFLYSISRPDEDGHRTAFGKYLGKQIADAKEKWETKNHLMTAALQQAAHDKHLFYGVEKNSHVELKYPEMFQHGSPYNVPAGSGVNLDKVMEHYRKQHLDEEERKAKKLAAAAQ